MKRIVILMLLTLSLCACGTNDVVSEQEIVEIDNFEDDKQEVSFEDANVFEIELVKRDDETLNYDDYNEIIATFSVKNISGAPIDYCSFSFNFTDESGNEICKDGRYHDCQIEAGKTALIQSYSYLEGIPKSDVKNINVTSYDYSVGDKTYYINLQTQEVTLADQNTDSYVEFENTNNLEFILEDKGVNSINSYEVGVQIKNNGSIPVKQCSYKMAYFDESKNFLTSDGRYSDSLINTGNYVTSKSFGDTGLGEISSFEVYSYDYTLIEPDEYGYDYYEINLKTKTVKGYLLD